ncbi:MAG: fibronectin type III domain-containing protein [Methylococcales bacterium]
MFVAQTVLANEALLTETLQLSIPQIRYQTKAAHDQWLWANLQYTPSQDGRLLFLVKEYGQATALDVPLLLPLSSISDHGAPQITQLNSDSARITYRASTPLACSVVYGTDRQFGAVATDPNMNGGALTEHHPVMTGLKADTDYFYRLQGTAANGNLYWSEIGSFHTPVAEATTHVNLAALSNGARVYKVSSNFGGVSNDKTWGANSAIDGSAASAWSSNGDGDNAFIEISLSNVAAIKTVEVWSRSMTDGSAKIRRFTVTVDSGQVFGPFTLASTDKAYSFDLNATTKNLRFNIVESSGGNTGLIEFGVY